MNQTTSALANQPVLDVGAAPLPTQRTLSRRRSIPLQFLRFLAFNTRILRMVVKGHQG